MLAVCEVSFFNSFIPFCTIGAFLVATNWWQACDDPCLAFEDTEGQSCIAGVNSPGDGCVQNKWCVMPDAQHPAGTQPHTCITHLRPWGVIHDYIDRNNLTVLFSMVAFGLCVSKMVDRIAKFYIVALQGAFFFALLDTFRRLATAIVAVFAFGEALTGAKIIALMLSILAIFLHSYSSHKKALAKSQAELFQSYLEPPTYEEEQERLRQRYASARGLPDDASWEDIEEHDANFRKEKGLSRLSLAAAASTPTDAAQTDVGGGGGGDGMGASLLGDDGGGGSGGQPKNPQQGVWDFLGLDFLLEASNDVRLLRGATAEDADLVTTPGSSRPVGSAGSSAVGAGTLGTFSRMTRSGLTAEEDLDQAFDVAFNNYN
jgi:hypothetical protein